MNSTTHGRYCIGSANDQAEVDQERGARDGARLPLFFDLDGSLIQGDLLVDAMIACLKQRPWYLIWFFILLLRGRAHLKMRIAELHPLDLSEVTFRREVLDFAAAEARSGRTLVLATATPRPWAEAIVKHLGLFAAVLATDEHVNLKGRRKLQAIEEFCRLHGAQGFGYVGDSRADIPIWQAARERYLAGPHHHLPKRLGGEAVQLLSAPGRRAAPLRSMRPHQWTKNILVFVPLVLAQQLTNTASLWRATVAFGVLCLCASATYMVNDLSDAVADRRHPRKRFRPIASGEVGAVQACVIACLLFVVAMLLVALLPVKCALLILAYLVTATVYTIEVKRRPIIDVIVLAGLYSLRILIGGVASDVVVSEWTLAFSMFLFLSLAFVKRFSEVQLSLKQGTPYVAGRGYETRDLSLLESFGIASGYLAVLVLALYINSQEMHTHYKRAWPLWLACPLLLYWISRVWLWAKREQLHDDPVVFALTDWVSLVIAACVVILLVLATFPLVG